MSYQLTISKIVPKQVQTDFGFVKITELPKFTFLKFYEMQYLVFG